MNEKRDPTNQAVHILRSYLKALDIPVEIGTSANELIVKKSDGADMKVIVGSGVAEVSVSPEALATYKIDAALAALHSVTEPAGYGRPLPVDRGARPEDRINYQDNFEDVYLRHSIFRRSPNRSDEELEPYLPLIKKMARKAMYRWTTTLAAMGFSADDLVSVGLVHTVTFLHNYAYGTTKEENTAKLADFLMQRFGEMAKVSHKKAQNATCLPTMVRSEMSDDGEVSYIDTYAETADASPDEEYDGDTFKLTYPNGDVKTLVVESDGFLGLKMTLNGRELTKFEASNLTEAIRTGRVQKSMEATQVVEEETEEARLARHEAAKRELTKRLMEMPLEKRRDTLGYAAFARDYAEDTRRAARKLADELICPSCKLRVPSGLICLKCQVEAVSKFGVDYVQYKEELSSQRHALADSMTAPIPESELRARAKRPVDRTVTVRKETEGSKPVVQIGKVEADMKVKELSAALMAKLPEIITCPKCKKDLPKALFGIRVAKDKATGIPHRASRQSYCTSCRATNK